MRSSKDKTTEEGFSLVELILAIFILSLLSGIAITSFSGVIKSSNIKACQTDWLTISSAVVSYENDYGTPTASADLNLYANSDIAGQGKYMIPLSSPKLSAGGKYDFYLDPLLSPDNPIFLRTKGGTVPADSTDVCGNELD
jgi:prepilin-type N-terminal cleavage/methylation domain-containing protein